MSVSAFSHNGKQIILVDYTACKTQQEMIAVMKESAEYYMARNGKFLVLNDFTGTFGSQEFMNEAKKLTDEVFAHKMEKAAALGITGIKKILLDGYNLFTKTKIHPFKSREEALNYLTK